MKPRSKLDWSPTVIGRTCSSIAPTLFGAWPFGRASTLRTREEQQASIVEGSHHTNNPRANPPNPNHPDRKAAPPPTAPESTKGGP